MHWRVQTIIEIVLSEPEHDHTLAALAQRVDLSPWHLSRLFKAELGISLKQYLDQFAIACTVRSPGFSRKADQFSG